MEDSLQRARRRISYIVFGLALAMIGLSALLQLARPDDFTDWTISLLQNVGTEALGAFLVLWLVDILLGDLQTTINRQREKDDLIFKMSNPNDNNAALEAARLARERGYLTDGSLQNKTLHWAKRPFEKSLSGSQAS